MSENICIVSAHGASRRGGGKFPDPHSFDITRDSINHLTFGAGPHVFAGINLAGLEMNAVFSSPAKMVRRLHIEHEERIVNNVPHGFPELSISVERY